MTDAEQKKAAKAFAENWKGKGYEKGESQPFWLSLLRDVYGVEHPENYIKFEDTVFLGHTSFIDGYIADTKVLIEQKSLGKDLKAPIKQSDGTLLSPFQQAKRYITELPLSKHPRFVITCNFSTFFIYDMENPSSEPEEIELENLEKDYYRLSFLVDSENVHLKREMELSMQAGDIVGFMYDALLKQYKEPDNPESLKSLNMLCVRLVFCLYAEDAGIFGRHSMFHDYLAGFDIKNMRRALIDLFKVLDTKPEDRDPYLDEELLAFPYVNGGLFSKEDIEIPQFTEEIKDLLLAKASDDFDWSEISPTIFGAVFESTLNPDTRRSGGMHYTTIENIHKVIDPLFLDDLRKELEEIKSVPVERTRNSKLIYFQQKLSQLTFLDPACGSGNFLTETYISLRRLENEALATRLHNQMMFGSADFTPIKVSIGQFYGIEINDFAVTVAKTALWIAESQMMKETESIVLAHLEFLPLKSYANIVEGNALVIDWESVVPKRQLNYIMGNPPFVGYSLQSEKQKDDILSVYVDEKGKPYKSSGKIDYVAGWYFKAAEYMKGTDIRSALVATNSITQGEQVAGIWKPLYERFGIHIDFAYKTFRWDSESNLKAHVHCVIVGFSCTLVKPKCKIYSGDRFVYATRINPYLLDAEVIIVESISRPICDVPPMRSGGKPVEGGYLIFTEEEKNDFIRQEPQSEKWFRQFMGSDDFINGNPRWCLWLVGITPNELRQMPNVIKRVEAVKKFRLNSKKAATREYASQPTRFMEIKQPDTDYLMIPATSSEKRDYIPIGYLNKNVVASNAASFVPDATLYHFGILTSNVHMLWMKIVCGRLKSDYRYSVNIVYNTFPWPNPSDEQKAKIEKTAKGILDARALYPDSSLADLYDENAMPNELIRAHQENDKAVMRAYGFTKIDENGRKGWLSKTEVAAALFSMYKNLTEK